MFNIFTRSSGLPGSQDSLLKSALTKNWPVFQFPPASRFVTTEATKTTEKRKEVDNSQETEQNHAPEADQQVKAGVAIEKDSAT